MTAFIFLRTGMSLSRQVSSKLALWSHRALPVSIIRLVIRTLKCRIDRGLLGSSFGQGVRLVSRILWNQCHWHMAMVVLARCHMRILASESVTTRNIRTFRCTCGRSKCRHYKRLTVRWRDVWSKVVVHRVAVTRRDGVKVRAVPERGVRILAACTLVLSSARLVGVIRVFLAVDGPQSLGFHHERLLLLIT